MTFFPTDDRHSAVPHPSYDRANVSVGIVHFGLGNFHRAHQAMYLDRLMSEGKASEWGICGVGVMPADARMRDVMREQDGLYTLVLRHPDGVLEPRVIGSVREYLFAPEESSEVLRRLAAPSTRIVSLTVTEGGYNIDRTTGEFDTENPAVQADLAAPGAPSTVFGYIVEGLALRRAEGTTPFTVMSCDNVPGNGHITRNAVLAHARLRDPGLAEWIAETVRFPNSMVDRITPVTTDEDRALVAARYGLRDAWPVMAEPFAQWVLEDDFVNGRPAYEDVGVQLVADVEPYELMKLRLLNAGHQALAYAGRLRGHRYAHEATADALVAGFVRAYMEEARATLPPVPGIDLDAYIEELLERFGNPHIADTLARLATDASDRIPKFVLPAVRDNLAAGRDVPHGAALVALWARYCEGLDEQGAPIELDDPLAVELQQRAEAQRHDPLSFLRSTAVFGVLAEDERFTVPYSTALDVLHDHGAETLLRHEAEVATSE